MSSNSPPPNSAPSATNSSLNSNQKFDFIKTFCELTKEFESPTSFWKWSAYAAVAAQLRFNCYLNWGTSKLYPNLYVLLLADSAAYRKDAPPELVAELLKDCQHTKVIMGRASWQGITDELAADAGNKRTGIPIKDGACIVIALELTAAFVEDPSLVKMMTEGYAFMAEYEYILRKGKTKITNRCINLLGGSNETLLRDMYNTQANYGGLLRRTCLIKPDGRRPPNSLDDPNSLMPAAHKQILIDQLDIIKNLKGEFIRTLDARRVWKDFYIKLYKSYEHVKDKSGFVEGAHTLISKLAMLIAASQNTLVITEAIIYKAIDEILSLKENYTSFMLGAGKNPHANLGAIILSTLWSYYQSSNGVVKSLQRREILLKHWNEISSEDLDKLLITLEGAALIKMISNGSEPGYILTDIAKDIFMKDPKTKA